MNFVDQWLGSGMIDISDPLGNQQLSFDFGERTRGVPKEMQKFSMAVMGLSLCDVARH